LAIPSLSPALIDHAIQPGAIHAKWHIKRLPIIIWHEPCFSFRRGPEGTLEERPKKNGAIGNPPSAA
jgi:hypothetical protein